MQIICVFTAKVARASLRCNVFSTFSYPSNVKHTVLRAFLEDCLPEMLSKLGVLAETSMKKSKKHHAIAPAALGGCGGLGQLWEALAELWDPTLDPKLDPTLDPTLDLLDPENMQEHFLRFATLCSAHRSPELVKSIPNASRKRCKCIF